MLHTTTPRRFIAATASAALVGTGLSLAATSSPAVADDPVLPALNWEISQQFDNNLSSHTYTGGVTEAADGVLTFPGSAATSYNPQNGTAVLKYSGSVTGTFLNPSGGAPCYDVTFADPTIAIDAAGEGTISASVSSNVFVGCGAAAATVAPTSVVLTTFDAPDWTTTGSLGSLTATPDWAGVIAPDSQTAIDLGQSNGSNGRPVAGKSWAASFIGVLPSSLRSHFYYTTGSDLKAPATFTATAEPVSATAQVLPRQSSYSAGLKVAVTGSNFRGVTNTGDAGVYVGLAPSGGMPDVSSPSGMSSFAASAYLPSLPTGAISTTLTAPTADLDPTKTYSVYTWQAHAHSNPTQDTETPVAINWGLLTEPGNISAVVTSASYAGGVDLSVLGSGFRAVTEPGDAGVYVGVAESGGLPDVSTGAGLASFLDAKLISATDIVTGAFSTTLHLGTAGLDRTNSYSIYTWQAHAHSNLSQDTVTALPIDFDALTKATTTTVTGQTKVKAGAGGTLTAAVEGPGTVTVTGLGAKQVVTVTDNAAAIKVPASLKVGTYTATVGYSGDGAFLAGSQTTFTVRVVKVAPVISATWITKPKVGGKAVLKVSVAGAAPSGTLSLKTKHDTAKNSINNVRLVVNPGSGTGRIVYSKAEVKKLGAGVWTVTISYSGDKSNTKAAKTITVRAAR